MHIGGLTHGNSSTNQEFKQIHVLKQLASQTDIYMY